MSNRCLVRPAIFLHGGVERILIAKLKDIVKRHQGSVVEHAADATHVVYRLPPMARDEGECAGQTFFLFICNFYYFSTIFFNFSNHFCYLLLFFQQILFILFSTNFIYDFFNKFYFFFSTNFIYCFFNKFYLFFFQQILFIIKNIFLKYVLYFIKLLNCIVIFH